MHSNYCSLERLRNLIKFGFIPCAACYYIRCANSCILLYWLCGGPRFKTTKLLQHRFSLSPFQGRSKEHGNSWRPGRSVVLREVNPIWKKGQRFSKSKIRKNLLKSIREVTQIQVTLIKYLSRNLYFFNFVGILLGNPLVVCQE